MDVLSLNMSELGVHSSTSKVGTTEPNALDQQFLGAYNQGHKHELH